MSVCCPFLTVLAGIIVSSVLFLCHISLSEWLYPFLFYIQVSRYYREMHELTIQHQRLCYTSTWVHVILFYVMVKQITFSLTSKIQIPAHNTF